MAENAANPTAGTGTDSQRSLRAPLSTPKSILRKPASRSASVEANAGVPGFQSQSASRRQLAVPAAAPGDAIFSGSGSGNSFGAVNLTTLPTDGSNASTALAPRGGTANTQSASPISHTIRLDMNALEHVKSTAASSPNILAKRGLSPQTESRIGSAETPQGPRSRNVSFSAEVPKHTVGELLAVQHNIGIQITAELSYAVKQRYVSEKRAAKDAAKTNSKMMDAELNARRRSDDSATSEDNSQKSEEERLKSPSLVRRLTAFGSQLTSAVLMRRSSPASAKSPVACTSDSFPSTAGSAISPTETSPIPNHLLMHKLEAKITQRGSLKDGINMYGSAGIPTSANNSLRKLSIAGNKPTRSRGNSTSTSSSTPETPAKTESDNASEITASEALGVNVETDIEDVEFLKSRAIISGNFLKKRVTYRLREEDIVNPDVDGELLLLDERLLKSEYHSRWCVLKGNRIFIMKHRNANEAITIINLKYCLLDDVQNQRSGFMLRRHGKDKNFFFQAEDFAKKMIWMEYLLKHIYLSWRAERLLKAHMAYGSQEFIEWHREGLSAVPSETKPDDSGEQTETQVMGGVVSARGESDSLEVGKGDAARADNIDNSGKESGLKHEPFEEHVATTNAYVIGTRNDRPDTPRAIADADACTSGVPVVVHAENGEVVAEKEANHGEPTQETTRVD